MVAAVSSDFMDNVLDFFEEVKEKLGEFFIKIGEGLGNIFDPEKIKQVLSSLWESTKEFAKTGLVYLKNGIVAVGHAFSVLGEKIGSVASTAFENIKAAGGFVYDKAKEFGSFLVDKFKSGLAWAEEHTPKILSNAKDALGNFLKGTKDFCLNMGRSISSFCSNIRDRISNFSQKIVSGAVGLKEKLADKFDVIAPRMKEFFANAKAKVGAAAGVIAGGVKQFAGKLQGVFNRAKEATEDAFSAIKADAKARREARTATKSAVAKKSIAKADAIAAVKSKVDPEPFEEFEEVTQEQREPMSLLWPLMKVDLMAREGFNKAFISAVGGEENFLKLIDGMDKTVLLDEEVFTQIEDYDFNLENALTYIGAERATDSRAFDVIAGLDNVVASLQNPEFPIEDKRAINAFFDKYKDCVGIDYGFGLNEALEQLGEELSNMPIEENVEREDKEEETQALTDIGAVELLPVTEDSDTLVYNGEETLPYKEELEEKYHGNLDFGAIVSIVGVRVLNEEPNNAIYVNVVNIFNGINIGLGNDAVISN